MKKLIVLAALATTALLLPGKAAAANPLLLNLTVSGTVEVWTNSFTSNETEYGINISGAMSFNNKYIYALISNAVANAYGNLGTNLTSTNLPADGYIAFNVNGADNPGYPDGGSRGTFYVTNKSGLFYLLSGWDKTNGYYSFIELDNANLDFSDNFGGSSSGGYRYKTNKGTYTVMGPSVFYVHDNPYQYDDGDYPGVIFNNYTAIEIRSNLKAEWSYTNLTLTAFRVGSTGGGCGTAEINGNNNAGVTTGKVTLSP